MSSRGARALVCFWVTSCVFTGGYQRSALGDDPKPTARAPASAGPGRPQVPITPGSEEGSLSAEAPALKPAATGTRPTSLSARETEALLARLEPLPELSLQNAAAPAVRAPSAPPPRAGAVKPIAFVTPQGRPAGEMPSAPRAQPAATLAAPEIWPAGDVKAASGISIRFAEPMVEVRQVGPVHRAPATIQPSVDGTWRWIDTRVLTFAPSAGRFPKATTFVVTVPAGTRSSRGAVLAQEATGTFSTAPIQIVGIFPHTPVRPDAPIAVELDEEADGARLEAFLRVNTGNGRRLATRRLGLDEARRVWARHPLIASQLTGSSAPRLGPRHVVLAPVTAWPADTDVHVVLTPGAPSREGPRPSGRESSAMFTVAPAFTVRGISCGDADEPRFAGRRCPASGWLSVELSNPIAGTSYRSAMVQVEGEPFADNRASGSSVGLSAPAQVGRTYHVAIDAGLVDIHGQSLVGDRRPSFTTTRERFWPLLRADDGLQVLDPRFQIPQWVITAEAVASVRVQLFAVQPSDYFAYQRHEGSRRAGMPGRRVLDQSYAVGQRSGAHVRVDLRPALQSTGTGHVVALATASAAPGTSAADRAELRKITWIQVTRLGLSARIDGEKVSAWIQDITPANLLEPVEGVSASLEVAGRGDRSVATSGKDGHVGLELLPRRARAAGEREPSAILIARAGKDSTFAAISGSHEKALRTRHALWYVTDDRFTYKPGETIYLKGWVRWTHDGVNPGLALPAAGEQVRYIVRDSQRNKLAEGTTELSGQGGFDLALTLPPTANLGMAWVELETREARHSHPLSIQEFRRPAYQVTLNDDVSHAGARPLVLGESIEMSAAASYYAGGGLAGAEIRWQARLKEASFTPPGWGAFAFTPAGTLARQRRGDWRDDAVEVSRRGSLSAASSGNMVYGITALAHGAPGLLHVDATITDLDRMSIRATSREILVHPSVLYVGIRAKPRHTDVLELVVVDIDGNAVSGVPMRVRLTGVLGSERRRDDAKLIDTQAYELVSGREPIPCPFKRRDLDTAYTAVAGILDARGRANTAELELPWYAVPEREKDLALVPDKASYRPGEVAKIQIRSAVLPATAVLTFARQGVIAQRRLELTKPSTTVELPIEPSYVENVHVIVDRVGRRAKTRGGSELPLPGEKSAQIDLPVEIDSLRLAMKARPTQPLVGPGDDATFEVEVRHDGKPRPGAEVALMVVDEAVLAVSGRYHADPLEPFYRKLGHRTSAVSTISLIRDAGPELAGGPGVERYKIDGVLTGTGSGSGYGRGYGGLGGRRFAPGAVVARKDFRATAVFSPLLATDANGKVRLTVKMPDSLTRFRVVALATADTRYFGKAESTIVTERKLNARTVAPRFLTQGDTFSLPVVVQNLDARPRAVEVAVRAANLVSRGPAGQRVIVAAGQRAEVRFDLATQARGRAVVQTIASSDGFADASTVDLPVYEPASTESFATYGTIDDEPRFERLAVPESVFADVGGVEAELASTQLQSLTDAYWYVYRYPYECAEQRSARMLATSALTDILDAFATPGRPTRQEIEATRARDLQRLAREQRPDGGWGYFEGMASAPYVTMQVLSALVAQRATGPMVAKAKAFVARETTSLLAQLERSAATFAAWRRADGQPGAKPATAEKPAAVRSPVVLERDRLSYLVSLAAEGLSSLATAGVAVGPRVERLHALASRLGDYPVDAKARLLSLAARQPAHAEMRAALLRDLLSATHETAGSATVAVRFKEAERLLLVSVSRTSALVLDALIRERPEHPIIAKLARGLLEARRQGRWASTQENLVVLQAMRRYFDAYEKATPRTTGRLWVGSAAYAEERFVGRGTTRASARLAWPMMGPGSTHDLAFAKSGPGRMYYRVGITYAPKRTDLPPLDAGFIVRRRYMPIDDPRDVTELPQGWKIRLGARVRVTLEALNTTARHAVALVDPLPAGFEIVNEALATSERAAVPASDTSWDHTNLRDNRAEAFAMTLGEGTHRFSYTVRATTPGAFTAAPAKAEEMYSPETFGRSAGQRVVIE